MDIRHKMHAALAATLLATALVAAANTAHAGGGWTPPGIQPCFNPGGCGGGEEGPAAEHGRLAPVARMTCDQKRKPDASRFVR